jgi:glycosyltransferase involved in cell wall biosynthesis
VNKTGILTMMIRQTEGDGGLKASVIICTHNPRPHVLNRTLKALSEQSLDPKCWELIVVDNHSDKSVAEVFPLPERLQARHAREEKLGLTSARLRGIAEARADLLVFVDDDNLLAPDYLEVALGIDKTWPQLGLWGGQQLPEFEVQPEPWVFHRQYLLALHTFDRDSWSNVAHHCPLPPGAGMCIRKHIANKYAELVEQSPNRRSLDRTGTSLASCGDTDLAFMTCDLGFGTGLFKDLKLTHLIPKERLTEDYFVKVTEMTSYSWEILLAIRGEWRPPPPLSLWQRIQHWRYEQTVSGRERRFLEAERNAKAKAQEYILKHNITNQSAPGRRYKKMSFPKRIE